MPTQEEKQKINKLARNFGASLCQTGLKIIQTTFRINPVELDYEEFRDLFLNLSDGVRPVLLDGKYYLEKWSTWQNIIEVDWTDTKKYVRERFDCDNMSFSFCSRVSWLFGLNSKGAVYGAIYNRITKKLVGYHYWVCIVSNEPDGTRQLFYLEPQTDERVKYEKGKPIIMGNWLYEPINARFY